MGAGSVDTNTVQAQTKGGKMDPRNRQLAETLVDYSMGVKKGDNVLVETIGTDPLPLSREVVTVAIERGAKVHTEFRDEAMLRRLLLGADEDQIRALAEFALPRMEKMQCYIGIRGASNTRELSDVPPERMKLFNQLFIEPVHLDCRVKRTRWVVLRYPNNAMAQQAQMSQDAFADFYYRVCMLDYGRMSAAMEPLLALMLKTDRVRILAPDTDLEFSIKDIPAIKCDGHLNIPDGELFTAPVRDSVNGTILFNTPTLFDGVVFPNVRARFVDGRAVETTTDGDNDKLNAFLNRDEGARYVGEFALGFNPHILEAVLDTLFDEKIAGSLHMALGKAYDRAPNGNVSMNHWDMVHRQTPEVGGGKIWFDDTLIRQDGRFVLPELEGLNPENLV
ncbi:MAG: aminopeptidase [Patescibacteria group bacterium]